MQYFFKRPGSCRAPPIVLEKPIKSARIVVEAWWKLADSGLATYLTVSATIVTSAPIVHVVDDDESFRTAIARLLRATKYEVRTYTGANDFLSRFFEDGPGCIVLDLRMPGVSGLALQEALATHLEGRLPIIFLSGHGETRARTLAMQAGAIDFLYKPVQPKDLFEAIEKAFKCDADNRSARERSRQATPGSASPRA